MPGRLAAVPIIALKITALRSHKRRWISSRMRLPPARERRQCRSRPRKPHINDSDPVCGAGTQDLVPRIRLPRLGKSSGAENKALRLNGEKGSVRFARPIATRRASHEPLRLPSPSPCSSRRRVEHVYVRLLMRPGSRIGRRFDRAPVDTNAITLPRCLQWPRHRHHQSIVRLIAALGVRATRRLNSQRRWAMVPEKLDLRITDPKTGDGPRMVASQLASPRK
jgi:hypothetical protein